MPTILDDILAHKRGEVEAAKRATPERELTRQLAAAPPARNFAAAFSPPLSKGGPRGVANSAAATSSFAPRKNALSRSERRRCGGVSLIAEVKKASPSAGIIREDFDPVAIAKTYESHGAACLSVLTDEKFFQGRLEYLREVRAAAAIPVMRKDFLIDRYQVLEARVAGADCVLLIAECLDDAALRDLYSYAGELGMDALVELYEPANLDRVLDLQPRMLGINNRNLKTFETKLEHTLELLPRIPNDVCVISESGIRNRADVERLHSAGVTGILVGETLMRHPDIGAAVDELLGRG